MINLKERRQLVKDYQAGKVPPLVFRIQLLALRGTVYKGGVGTVVRGKEQYISRNNAY